MRQVPDGKDVSHKLIYYPTGNHFQLFDLKTDPHELIDVYGKPENRQIREFEAKLKVTLWF